MPVLGSTEGLGNHREGVARLMPDLIDPAKKLCCSVIISWNRDTWLA
jgi:hypothetical protein